MGFIVASDNTTTPAPANDTTAPGIDADAPVSDTMLAVPLAVLGVIDRDREGVMDGVLCSADTHSSLMVDSLILALLIDRLRLLSLPP